MKDEYIKAAEAMNGIGNFGAVDATAEQMLASKYKIQGIESLPFPIDRFPYSSYLHSSFWWAHSLSEQQRRQGFLQRCQQGMTSKPYQLLST